MRFPDFYTGPSPAISFELFPPRTPQGWARLERRIPRLLELKPAFLTVTYGALGSTRERTLEIVSRIRNGYGHDVAHHLTCVGADAREIERMLVSIREAGIENIVALRGDPPRGESQFIPKSGGYAHASELVAHIRRFGGFGVAVAGYPEKHVEAPDLETDLAYLKRKVEAGADVVLTQLFYDNRVYYEFVRRCRALGITQPIVPGLLPILDVQQIQRITGMCGSTIPPALKKNLQEAEGDPARVQAVGIRHTRDQALDLIAHGVPGIHFYVLNRCFHIAEIMAELAPRLGE